MDTMEKPSFSSSASSRAPVFFAQALGISAVVLMIVWLLHFRGGLNLNSHDKHLIFNVHPFLMFVGYIFISGQAMMAYNTVPAKKKVQKFIHMMLHLISLSLGIVGIYAVFKYHNEMGISNMNSLHSWLGISTFCLYGLQWLFGFFCFWVRGVSEPRRKTVHPLHRMAGVSIFLMAICTAETGLTESFIFGRLQKQAEARLITFTGLIIIIYGFAVCLSVIR